MKNTKVSKVMLSTLVTGGIVFTSFYAEAMKNEVEAPNNNEKRETQIELPSSALIYNHSEALEGILKEGDRLEAERKEERLRIELEKARVAEEARLAKIEAERKAKEEAERKIREEAERKRQAELQRQAEIEAQKAQQAQQRQRVQQEQSTSGIAMNGSYYTPYCEGCSGVTATGYDVRGSIYVDGMRVVAVDPNVIPLYSIVEVSTPSETFTAIALDTGGAIKGNRIDILVADKQTAYSLGRHTVYVKVLRSGK